MRGTAVALDRSSTKTLDILRFLNPEVLIPAEWVLGQPVPILLVIGAFALWLLCLGADWLVESASHVACRFGIPKVVVGATIVSLGTTTPEFAVSVMAAWAGNSGLALGNAVGSVIVDTALIFGLGCLLVSLPADRHILSRQGWWQFGSAVLLAMICYAAWFRQGEAAVISRPVGFGLLALLGIYLIASIRWSRPAQLAADATTSAQHFAIPAAGGEEADTPHSQLLAMTLIRGLVGLILVVLAGRAAVLSAEALARTLGVPEVVLAASLVALGTSLPELMVGMTSIRRGHPELLVGNVIGADVLNILFVTGAAAAVRPLPIVYETGFREVFLVVHLPLMLLILTYFRICVHFAVRKGTFSRWMGIPLLCAYVLSIVLGFLFTGPS